MFSLYVIVKNILKKIKIVYFDYLLYVIVIILINIRLCGLIVRVRVVPRRTVVGDIDRRFDNLSGSHHQSHCYYYFLSLPFLGRSLLLSSSATFSSSFFSSEGPKCCNL